MTNKEKALCISLFSVLTQESLLILSVTSFSDDVELHLCGQHTDISLLQGEIVPPQHSIFPYLESSSIAHGFIGIPACMSMNDGSQMKTNKLLLRSSSLNYSDQQI